MNRYGGIFMNIENQGGKTPTKRKGRIKTSVILVWAGVAVLIAALVIGGLVFYKYQNAKSHQEAAKELYKPSDSSLNASSTGGDIVADEKFNAEYGISEDFVELYKVNSDTVGWISIPNTPLDLPVALGKDQSYYLNHTIEKKSNPFGVPFVDSRATVVNGFQSNNLTIYGHASKDGTYFAPVKKYKDVDYYKKNPLVTFNTIYGKGQYKIIGMFMENINVKNPDIFAYHDYIDMDEHQFDYYVESVKKRSYFTTGVDAKYGDQLITLSTCDTEVTNSTNTDYRVALVARKVRPDETITVDVSVAKENTEMIMPKGWVDKKGKANPYK